MSGIEVIGLISAVLTVIESTAKLFRAVEDAKHLPQTIHDAALKLPLVRDTL